MANEKRWSIAIERKFPNGDPVDIWAYTRCKPVNTSTTIPFFIDVEGEPVDFNPTTFGTIVTSSKMADIVSRFAGDEVQRLPAAVRGATGEWEVLNVLSVVDCINHSRSKIQYYPKDDPEKPGKPRGVMKLIVDSERALGHHFFNPEDWRVATIVSEELKSALESAGVTGIEFWPVTERTVSERMRTT